LYGCIIKKKKKIILRSRKLFIERKADMQSVGGWCSLYRTDSNWSTFAVAARSCSRKSLNFLSSNTHLNVNTQTINTVSGSCESDRSCDSCRCYCFSVAPTFLPHVLSSSRDCGRSRAGQNVRNNHLNKNCMFVVPTVACVCYVVYYKRPNLLSCARKSLFLP